MSGPGQAPTRSAVLELQNEQVVVREAYAFLDEKRLLLASELLRQLHRHQQLSGALEGLQMQANKALQAAVMHHGLDGLQVYPAGSLGTATFGLSTRNFMGVTLGDAELVQEQPELPAVPATNPSAEAEHCRQLFHEMLTRTAVLAGVSGNLHRLLAEYRITERRSRALENVILPEIDQALHEMSSHLEEIELEDAIRVYSPSIRRYNDKSR